MIYVIIVSNVHHYFNVKGQSIPIFHQLNLQTIHHGLVLISGDSGVGKSTLLSLLAGLLVPKSGKLFFINHRYSKQAMERFEMYQKHFRYVQQSFYLEGEWTVETYFKIFNIPACELDELGLEKNILYRKTKHLSGGEKVRIYLRIMQQASRDVLFLDEPTHGLDLQNKEKVIRLLSQNKGLVIVASHDDEFIPYASQIIHIEGPHEIEIKSQQSVHQDDDYKHIQKVDKRALKRQLVKTIAYQFTGQSWLFLVMTFSQIVFFSLLVFFGLTNQYKQHISNNPWGHYIGYITSVERQTIQDSPFDLVTYSPPSLTYLRQVLSDIEGVHVTANFRSLFPTSIEIDGEHFAIDFMNISFVDDQFSTWITHHRIVEMTHHYDWHFSLFDLDAPWEQSFQVSMPLLIKNQQLSYTKLEPSVIYFSLPQIRFLLQTIILTHPTVIQIEQLLLDQEEFLMVTIEEKKQFFTVQSRIEMIDNLMLIHHYSLRLDEPLVWIDAGIHLSGILMIMSGILNSLLFTNYLVIRLFHMKELLNHLMMLGLQAHAMIHWLHEQTIIHISLLVIAIISIIMWILKDIYILSLFTELQWVLLFLWFILFLVGAMKMITLLIKDQGRFPYADWPSTL